MGEVIVVLKLMPSDVESYDSMKQKVLKKLGKVEKVEEDYIAFGLKALKVTIVIPDSEGGTDKVEQQLSEIKEVGNVEVDGIGRI
jgi:elongation factor 1-beta